MMQKARHKRLWALVCARCPDHDLAHDREHVLRVFRWAIKLAPEAGADVELAGAAALVHDLVNIPKEHVDRPLGSARSAEASQGLLAEAGYSATEMAQIVEAVRTASWSRGLAATCPEGVVLQDADRLDAIGAIGIARTFACAQAMSGRVGQGNFYAPDDPLGRGDRALDDKRYAVDHFAIKLLRLAAGMQLPSAQVEARLRHSRMVAFLEGLEGELSPAGLEKDVG